MATNDSFERPAGDISGNLGTLTAAEFYWDSDGAQYYAIDAAVRNGTYRLDARPVDARTVAETLAVPAAEADEPVARAGRPPDYRAVIDEGNTGPVSEDLTLVATDEGYVIVTRAYEPAPDPFRFVKIAGYAAAGAGIVYRAEALSEDDRLPNDDRAFALAERRRELRVGIVARQRFVTNAGRARSYEIVDSV